jgi:tRNA dimethylallyltransferase
MKYPLPTVFLMGPTASGKTALAMELIKEIPAEIISVDSAMIYRGMDIGTGKPSSEELKRAPHHLIDICDPNEAYSAQEFRVSALKLIQQIKARNRIPLLVGGTLLYFRALQQGLSALPSANPVVRERILKEAQEKGWNVLHDRLKMVDPKSAARIHQNDPQRIQRALEVYEIVGKPMSLLWEEDHSLFQNEEQTGFSELGEVLMFAILPNDRSHLHHRIEKRFHQMLANGFMEEVKHLHSRGDLDLTLPSMRAVGYRQIWQYLNGDYSYSEMVDRSIACTRQLAKRQLTWLRSLNKNSALNIINLEEIENNLLVPLKTMIHCLT